MPKARRHSAPKQACDVTPASIRTDAEQKSGTCGLCFQHIGETRYTDERGPEAIDVYLDRQFHRAGGQQPSV